MKNTNKNKLSILALTVMALITFSAISPVAFATVGFDDFDDTGAAIRDYATGDPQGGLVGGLGDIAGNAVKDSFESLFGETKSNQDITSFIDFKGGLTAPSGEGLDPTLKRSENLREFILNIVNFVLSFLGIIAVVIVIYGGFLYVTAAGNEEQAGKGKKAITYAAIGIIIIIASFAIVSTLLQAGGGSGTDTSNAENQRLAAGDTLTGVNIGQQAIYDLAASSVNTTITDFTNAYRTLLEMYNRNEQLKNLQPDAFVRNLNILKNKLKGNKTPTIAINELLDIWNKTPEKVDEAKIEEIRKKLEEAYKKDFDESINAIIGKDKDGGRFKIVKGVLGEIVDTTAKDAINRGFKTDKDLQKAFADIDPTMTVNEVFNEAVDSLDAARVLADEPMNQDLFKSAIKSLLRLSVMVKNIEFVFVKISAGEKSGNAPFIVELNGLGSNDPTGVTITDDRYEWEPFGPNEVQGAVDCNTRIGATITCTYNQPGTYNVQLKIKSSDPSMVATGQSFLKIKVDPSVARIALRAKVGDGTVQELRKYKKDDKDNWVIDIDANELQVTTGESKNPGITFDSTGTQAGDGTPVKTKEWSFGDGGSKEKTDTVIHKYSAEGKYQLTLAVTDNGNRKDRKFLNVIVASIASRVLFTKTIAEPDELVEFDGSSSRSDQGAITSYIWKIYSSKTDGSEEEITDLQNKIEIVGKKDGSSLRARFKDPGAYRVTLTVSNGTASATYPSDNKSNMVVKSRKPRANFGVSACPDNCVDPAKPSVIELDAGSSFDPDKDELIYAWNVFDDQNTELEKGGSFDEENTIKACSNNKTLKKICLRFTKTGKYKIRLTLKDKLPESIQQTDTFEKDVTIDSVVDVEWDPNLVRSVKLENGEAFIEFKGAVRNATRVQIDFGDAITDEKSITLDTSGNGEFAFKHTYTEARSGGFMVTLKAISEENAGENTLTKRVYIAKGDAPMAVITAMENGVEIDLNDPNYESRKSSRNRFIYYKRDTVAANGFYGIAGPAQILDSSTVPFYETIRNKSLTFDASYSVGSNGTDEGLSYSWDFGDNKRSTGKTVEHSFTELSGGNSPFTVTLIVSEDAIGKTDRATFPVMVLSTKPQVATLSLEKKTPGQVTPVDIELTAEGAVDPDGRITNYQFWYYDPTDKEKKLSVVDTEVNHATLTVETAGEESEEHEYIFCVSVTDNENAQSECAEMFGESDLPKLKVKNGANKAPTALFTVDRTTVKIGEPVMLTSISKDEDGRIAQYIWDAEGDGFQNDNPSELSTVTHRYEKKSPPGGFRVKLKVIDDKGAAGYSKDIPIYVYPKSNPPTAAFHFQVLTDPPKRVKFLDDSKADTANSAKIMQWIWDFDTSTELGCETDADHKPDFCNGDKTDDVNSTDQNPVFDFPQSGSYQVKLTVKDSDENISEPKTQIVLLVPTSGGTTGTTTVSTELKAELKSDPAFTYETIDGKKTKVLSLPANSNGENITFYFGDSKGKDLEYTLDKNIWCDSSDDGQRSNDDDIKNGSCKGASADTCKTNYQRYTKTAHPKGPGNFTPRLTIKDKNNPIKVSTDQIEIRFEGETDRTKVDNSKDCNGQAYFNPYAASFVKNMSVQNIILLGLLSGAILTLLGYELVNLFQKGKVRNE